MQLVDLGVKYNCITYVYSQILRVASILAIGCVEYILHIMRASSSHSCYL